MKKKPKLILCDIDGTLIDRTQAVTPAFEELKTLIREHNLCFSLASARSLELQQMYIDALEIKNPVLINNGAGARVNGQVMWDEFLPPLCVKEAVLEANRRDMAIFLCWGDKETVYRHNAYIQREIDLYNRYNHFYIPLESEWPDLKLERVMITDPEKVGRVDEILPYLEPYADQIEIVRNDARHLDVMQKGITKGGAIRRLAGELGIEMEEIMAIGDGINDIEMLSMVGTGVAVGNACEELKQVADYICEAENTYGVIEAVRRFCTDGEPAEEKAAGIHTSDLLCETAEVLQGRGK